MHRQRKAGRKEGKKKGHCKKTYANGLHLLVKVWCAWCLSSGFRHCLVVVSAHSLLATVNAVASETAIRCTLNCLDDDAQCLAGWRSTCAL